MLFFKSFNNITRFVAPFPKCTNNISMFAFSKTGHETNMIIIGF